MDKMTEQDGGSLDIVNENLEALKNIFPDAVAEEGVDFDALRQLLGDGVDEGEEKYGLNWHGKKKARQIALTPSTGTLRPCSEESVDWGTTQNLFIEGDNLEVLKLLQKSYAGKVKMIYIDPPYNTGKEFIYPDKFQDNLETYLKYTGQKDDEGMKFSSNTESSGRYHTNWLNMIYPRLKLARNLLNDNGIIFISIDDNEAANLLKICEDIFGEENLLGVFVWQRRQNADSRNSSNVSVDHEYVIAFQKSADARLVGKSIDISKYKNPDNDTSGDWASIDLSGLATKDQRPNLHYDIVDPSTNISYPPNPNRGWSKSKNRVEEMIKDGRILFPKSKTGRPREKKFLEELQSSVTGFSTWLSSENAGFTTQGTREVTNIFKAKIFDFPKPGRLIDTLCKQATNDGDIILDFFAGSCTTAHSVLKVSCEDGRARRFVMVQLPEPTDEKSEAHKAGYFTIADIGRERMRRVISKIKEENPKHKGDLGFKVFKLDSSNIRAWNPDRGDLEQTLLDHTEHLVEGRNEQDLLYELLLKRGVDLTIPIEEKKISDKTVYSIGYGVLFACLDTAISRDVVEGLGQGIIDWHKELEPASDTQVVFRDSAFSDDISKTNMTAILEQHGIAHVRSL